jgi:hypothetical protein
MAQPKTTETATTVDPNLVAAISRATLEAVKQVTRPENADPAPAWWNGYGLPDFPKLTWQTVFFCGAKLRPSDLTKDETALLNQVRVPGTYGPDKTWEVIVRGDGKTLDLRVRGINTIEVRMGMPSFKEFLRTIVEEQAVVA